MPRLRSEHSQAAVAGSVTTLELFFDLVFVFTITQLTSRVEHGHGMAGIGQAALLLILLWWMYGGYAWLTNSAPPVTPRRRTLLLLGMIGNFVCALSIPQAYDVNRWPFALGYALVVAVHAGMFVTEARPLRRRGTRRGVASSTGTSRCRRERRRGPARHER